MTNISFLSLDWHVLVQGVHASISETFEVPSDVADVFKGVFTHGIDFFN